MISEKVSENSENYQFLKFHKKSGISKISSLWCFCLSRLGSLQSPILEFDKKKCTQNAYLFQKVDFCIF